MKKLNNKWFTLVELLTVILILLVILAVAMPSITSALKRTETKQLNSVKSSVASRAVITLARGDFSSSAEYNKFTKGSCYVVANNSKLVNLIGEDVYGKYKSQINKYIGYNNISFYSVFIYCS